MNPFGAPSHLFHGPPAAVAAAVGRHGLTCVQLTPNFTGLHFHEPGQVTAPRCRQAAEPFRAAGLGIACLAAPAPLLDSNLDRRHRRLIHLHALVRHCRDFGTDRIVVETGSLGSRSPWAPFPPNRSAEAWAELRLVLGEVLRRAADHGVTLLLKPDSAQVLAGAEDAVRLREELPSDALRFVMDPANLLLESPPREVNLRLPCLFEQLGAWAPVVHLKDLRFDPAGVATPRAGRGVLDFALFARLLRRWQPAAPVILAHLRPEEVAATRAFVEPFFTAREDDKVTS